MHRFAWLISYSCKIENNTFNNTFTYIARRSKGPLCVFNCKIPDISYFLRPLSEKLDPPLPLQFITEVLDFFIALHICLKLIHF